jgi:periplasmic mercuric ion binding protein
MKKGLIIFGIMLISFQYLLAQQVVTIKTSAQCGMCKDRIEKALAYEKGVISSELSLDTKDVVVKYKESKTNPDKIREAIAKLGHDADNIAGDPKAYAKLPACCKKPDDPNYIGH